MKALLDAAEADLAVARGVLAKNNPEIDRAVVAAVLAKHDPALDNTVASILLERANPVIAEHETASRAEGLREGRKRGSPRARRMPFLRLFRCGAFR